MARKRFDKVVSPKGLAQYPHITEPDEYKGTRNYKTGLLIDPAEEGVQEYLDKLTELAEQAFAEGKADLEEQLKEAKGKKLNSLKGSLDKLSVHLPFEPEYDDEGAETGRYVVNYKAVAGGVISKGPKTGQTWERKVPIFDAEKKDITASAQVWFGATIKVQAEVIPFTMLGDANVSGVSLRLYAVQLIELAPGGDRSDGFGVEDGYVAEQSAPADQSASSATAVPDDDEEDEDEDF